MHNLETVQIDSRKQTFNFWIRRNTSDRQVLKEVIEQNAYRRNYFTINPGERWLDLGANMGAFTCLAAQQGAIVKAYEPEPDNCKLIRRNLELNGLNAEVHQCAVVADAVTASSLPLYTSTDYGKWGHSLFKPKRKNSILVPTVRFSSLLSDVDGIKMDIEGAEIPILSSVETMAQVQKLVFEWHFDIQPQIAIFTDMIARLGQFFPHMKYRPMKPGETLFTRYPTESIVFCWK